MAHLLRDCLVGASLSLKFEKLQDGRTFLDLNLIGKTPEGNEVSLMSTYLEVAMRRDAAGN